MRSPRGILNSRLKRKIKGKVTSLTGDTAKLKKDFFFFVFVFVFLTSELLPPDLHGFGGYLTILEYVG